MMQQLKILKKKNPDHSAYCPTNDFSTFSCMFEKRWKQEKLASSNNLNTFEQCAIKIVND